jgi:hypothetical protein
MPQHHLARALEMFAVDDRPAPPRAEARQFGLALDQRQAAQIATVEMKKIEEHSR